MLGTHIIYEQNTGAADFTHIIIRRALRLAITCKPPAAARRYIVSCTHYCACSACARVPTSPPETTWHYYMRVRRFRYTHKHLCIRGTRRDRPAAKIIIILWTFGRRNKYLYIPSRDNRTQTVVCIKRIRLWYF